MLHIAMYLIAVSILYLQGIDKHLLGALQYPVIQHQERECYETLLVLMLYYIANATCCDILSSNI